jgi:3-oxoadipate CoA-transferase, beta subunit
MTIRGLSREQIARRAARDIPDGSYVNLGIGLPTLVANHIPEDREVIFHSENGILGFGPAAKPGDEDMDIINAGKQPVTLLSGASIFHHTDAFAMIRGGHLDLALLGAMQVSRNGDLANWSTGDAKAPEAAVGGAMDLSVGARQLWVLMEHTTKDGLPKILERCTYPLTAPKVINRIYSNLAVISVAHSQLFVHELAEEVTFAELQSVTAAKLTLVDNWRIAAPA